MQVLTEGEIGAAIVRNFAGARAGDSVDIAMFYLSDRPVIRALLSAASRGVTIRVLLDPNKDAFGFEKSGLPNREVASELVAASGGVIKVRWYRTHGEQFHAKIAAIRGEKQLWMTLGSANFTRRNLGDYNLEANAIVTTPPGSPIEPEMLAWFESLWQNHPGAHRIHGRYGSVCRSLAGHATGCTGSWKPRGCARSSDAFWASTAASSPRPLSLIAGTVAASSAATTDFHGSFAGLSITTPHERAAATWTKRHSMATRATGVPPVPPCTRPRSAAR